MQAREPQTNSGRHEQAVRTVADYLTNDAHLDAAEAQAEARDVLEEVRLAALSGLDRGSQRWWLLALRGLLGVAVGLLFLARPITAVITMALVFGAWIFVDGVTALVAAVTGRRAWYLGIAGLIGVAVGVLMLARPAITLVVFYIMAAAWMMARGVTEIALGVKFKHDKGSQIALVLLGIVSVLFGLFLLLVPVVGVLALGWWLAIYALTHGFLFLIVSFQLRHAKHVLAPPAT